MIKVSDSIISKIVRNGQLTIPANIRTALHLKDGDFVRVNIEDNRVIVTPVSVIDQDQSYFQSPKWQKSIQESEKAIKNGKSTKYSSAQQLEKDIKHD